jgi:hypothetical protein
MSATTDHGLLCPDGNEYAALVLAMQEDAQVVTANTTAQANALTTYNNRPWLLATSTSSTTTAQTLSEFTNPNSSLPGSIVPVGPTTGIVTRSGLGTFVTTGTPDPQGWYHVGGWATFQATGAVNTFTRRTLAVEWITTVNLVGVYDQAISTCYESNTGGDSLTVEGFFYADGIHQYTPQLVFAHRNSSSTMTVNTGAKMWITYLGSGVTP